LAETRDFEKAIHVAMDYADAHPGTLVVVTSDHETSGLAIPSNKTDFTLPESGISYNFATSSHTGIMVPVYLYGTGADQISGIMENSELSQKLQKMINVWE
jgi:alkaline phosphatase